MKWIIPLLLSWCIYVPVTNAQDLANADDAVSMTPIEEITVVSARTSKQLKELPSAISVIDKDDIQLGRQQLGLDESLTRVPGVFAQNRYNFAQDLRIAIRGFGARANFGIRGLKIYADGIPATTADGQSGVDDIDLGSLSRVEVVRGPSSALYGASAGGVLNLFTEEGPEQPYLQTAVTVGEDEQRRYQLKAGGQRGPLNYLLSLNEFSYDGYRDNAAVESTLFNSKFRYAMDDAELTLIVNLVDSPQADDAGAITAAQVRADPTQAQPRNLSSNAGEELDQQKLAWIYDRTLAAGVQLNVRNYYVWRDFEAFLPIGTHIPFVADDGVVAFDRFFYGGGLQVTFDHELFGKPNQLVAGFDVDLQKDDRQRYLNNAGVRGALSFDQVEEAEAYGIYLRNELALTDALGLILGLRYDDVELSVDDKFLSNADQSSNIDFDELSPMIGLVWAVNDDLSLYANYATSFETPTFTELANPARNLAVSLGGFNNVSAQQADSFELGLRSSFLQGRVYLEAALFDITVEDEIVSVANVGNRSFFENADTDRQGAEISAVSQFSDAWRLTVAYTYSDFEFDAFETNPSFVGNPLPGLPENQLFAELTYRPDSGWYAAADVLYVDDFSANNADTVSNDSSTVANLRVGYRGLMTRTRWNTFVGVNNVFDEEYNANVRINGFGGRLYEPGPERNVYVGVTIDFLGRAAN